MSRWEPQMEDQGLHSMDHSEYVLVADPFVRSLLWLQEIIDLIGTKFALRQVPKPEDIRFVASLPKTGVGKLDKTVIRKLLVNG
jgi:acyl-coenzyme A synthetase/AMP-(fatty) acid ligase